MEKKIENNYNYIDIIKSDIINIQLKVKDITISNTIYNAKDITLKDYIIYDRKNYIEINGILNLDYEIIFKKPIKIY